MLTLIFSKFEGVFALLFFKISIQSNGMADFIIVCALLPYRLSTLSFIASTGRNLLFSSSQISFYVLMPDLQSKSNHSGIFLKQILLFPYKYSFKIESLSVVLSLLMKKAHDEWKINC